MRGTGGYGEENVRRTERQAKWGMDVRPLWVQEEKGRKMGDRMAGWLERWRRYLQGQRARVNQGKEKQQLRTARNTAFVARWGEICGRTATKCRATWLAGSENKLSEDVEDEDGHNENHAEDDDSAWGD